MDESSDQVDAGSREPKNYRVAAVEKALRVLDVFAEPPHRFALTEIAVRTTLSPNQVFRLVQTLLAAGYLREERGTKHYVLGWRLFDLTAALNRSDDLLEATREPLQWAYEETGETVAVMVPNGEDAVIGVNVRMSEHPLLVSQTVGGRESHLHAGAAGKVVLASWNDEAVERYLSEHPRLVRFTPCTPATAEAVWAEVRKIRAQGYAISDQEIAEGMYGMAVPVRGRRGELLAVMTVAAPIARASDADQARHLTVLREAVRRVSLQLGVRTEDEATPSSERRFMTAC